MIALVKYSIIFVAYVCCLVTSIIHFLKYDMWGFKKKKNQAVDGVGLMC